MFNFSCWTSNLHGESNSGVEKVAEVVASASLLCFRVASRYPNRGPGCRTRSRISSGCCSGACLKDIISMKALSYCNKCSTLKSKIRLNVRSKRLKNRELNF